MHAVFRWLLILGISAAFAFIFSVLDNEVKSIILFIIIMSDDEHNFGNPMIRKPKTTTNNNKTQLLFANEDTW